VGEDGRPAPRPVLVHPRPAVAPAPAALTLSAPDFPAGGVIPARYAEDSPVSPRLVWSGVPEGTRSFALAVTDPDLPAALGFPRSFAHWLVHDIPAEVRELPEGASRRAMPAGARELPSDYVAFGIPGFGVGWGGPWPPDRPHRYLFTLWALKVPTLALAPDADLPAFAAAVLPVAIAQSSFTAVYGPALRPLPAPRASAEAPGGTG
jgi:Raf kinase inhibitor-like YbhB/YbcL family protein